MLSRQTIKHITSLQQKKYRELYGEFVVEGVKMVVELLNSSQELIALYCKRNWYELNEELCLEKGANCIVIDDADLFKISNFKSPNSVVAVAKIKPVSLNDIDLSKGFTLVLDDIRDPGNMGTIIRSADWFGFDQIVCSETSVDIYNPKVIQASMGSFLRVRVVYTDLAEALKMEGEVPVYGAFMSGTPVQELPPLSSAILVVGNESNGISPQIETLINKRISIPLYEQSGRIEAPESMNVAVAAGIIMHEFRKK